MLCKNPNCGIYRMTYDLEYDAEKDPSNMPCAFCGDTLKMTGADILGGRAINLVKETRPAQVDYVKIIDSQFEKHSSVTFIEGGTGVGKSYAYLIPLLLELLRDRTARAIIVTSNKALQTQLARDFPLLLEKLGAEEAITYGVLKGRNNYACPLLETEVPTYARRTFSKFIQELPASIDQWPGLKGEEDEEEVEKKLWWWKNVSTDNCPKPRGCKIDCCYKNAKYARVLITNYYYFATILQHPNVLSGGQKKPIGNLTYLVMDEAHQAISGLRNAYQTTVSPSYVKSLIRNLMNPDFGIIKMSHTQVKLEPLIASLEVFAKKLTQELEKHNENPPNAKIDEDAKEEHRYKFRHILLEEPQVTATQLGLDSNLVVELRNVRAGLKDLQPTDDEVKHNPKGCVLVSRINRQLQTIETLASRIASETFPESGIIVLDPRGLVAVVIQIGALLRTNLDRLFRHVVITSATLAQNGNDFTYARESFGYNQPTDDVVEAVIGSPFNYDRAARLYVPRLKTIPAKGGIYDWYEDITTEIVKLATASQGNGLVLFSSKKDMLEIEKRTRTPLAAANIPIVTQKEGVTASALKNTFLNTENALLFGLRSFWEGVDIQGEKLRLVIIPKLPFPVPDDPIIQSLNKKAGNNAFMTISIPLMLESLRQGVGRLIRSQEDMGIVAILDSRCWSGTSNLDRHKATISAIEASPIKSAKGYGSKIYRSLGLKVIDNQDYACNLMNQVRTFFQNKKSE